MLLLLDAGCPHPNLGSTSLRSMSPWGQVLPPAVVGTLMELVHATLLTAQVRTKAQGWEAPERAAERYRLNSVCS